MFQTTQNKIRPGPGGCIDWTGSKYGGYGRVMFAGKVRFAHRLVWWWAHGDPGKLEVCHTCDRPCCVNLDHLFLGTHKENMRDRHRKGRTKPRGVPWVPKLAVLMVRRAIEEWIYA